MFESVVILILGFGGPFIYFYLAKNPHFGGKLTKEGKADLQKSPHWDKGRFQNLAKTTMNINLVDIPMMIKESVSGKKNRDPKQPIPIVPFDPDIFRKDSTPKFIWYGHATLLLQLNDINLLIDPMFGPDASPVGPLRIKRFSKNSLDILKTLPQIDMILLTHDHYDHLDFKSIRHFRNGKSRFLVPLGVSRHLISWGISAERISEFDWWDQTKRAGLRFVFTPSRHFSGRGAFDRAKSLWGGWVIEGQGHKIFWSGDGGYGDHFKTIGEKLGPFDWGFMECGQYNERWQQIHMDPEEAVKAAWDAGVMTAIPFHWGAFGLAFHHWKEPVERFVKRAQREQQDYICPRIGQVVLLGQKEKTTWWEDYH